MRVALVHDYLRDFGGAERVLLTLSEMYPDAPIYTAFYKKGSPAHSRFSGRKIVASWAQRVPFFVDKLHSPLRFLAPQIWRSFDFSEYDLVISSASWYITKGLKVGENTKHISYVHTPPRYLYGYPTSVNLQKYWAVRQYAKIVNHYLRMYDFESAQKPDILIANSKNTQRRITKFYRRKSELIYPPVDLPRVQLARRGEYYLVISRLVGGKGIELAVKAANRMKAPLKVVGTSSWGAEDKRLKELAGNTVEFLGYVSDDDLSRLYAGAKAFLVMAEDEDFGITPVEAMNAGTPVIAYRGGGYLETVVDPSIDSTGSGQVGGTGVFFDELSVSSMVEAMEKLDGLEILDQDCIDQAQKFNRDVFVGKIEKLVGKVMGKK